MKKSTLVPFLALSLALAAPAIHAKPPAKPAPAKPPAAKPAPAKPAAVAPAPAGAPRAADMDADKDGKVTRAEWKGNDVAFAMLDANGDGTLAGAELAALGGQPAQDLAAAFASRDKNHDGRISKTEWAGGAGGFARLDRNHDGAVSKEEFTQR
ncbi:MAG TPA: EF-hand domain-containing protein [Thermoanaerobaculia bacterium]|jgi:hypothetical protein